MTAPRIVSALVLVGAGVIAFATPITRSSAGMRCGAGQPDKATGLCDCPAGFKSVGTAGNSECEAVAVVRPTTAASASGPAKAPTDVGTTAAIKGGVFKMGSDEGPLKYASPAHVVTISDFDLDKYEVTVDDYKKCVDAGICTAPPAVLTGVLHPERCNWGSTRSGHPMNCVSWQESVNYCAFRGKRLPTEAEWEYAARGGVSTHKYPWGTSTPTCKELDWTPNPGAPETGCGDGTSVVGSHPAGVTSQGVHDLAGNVEEWVWDWFAGFTALPGTNPGGPSSGTLRVVKGSSWDLDVPGDLDVARREGIDPAKRENWLGFRCVKGTSAPPPAPTLYTPIVPTPASSTTATPPSSASVATAAGSTAPSPLTSASKAPSSMTPVFPPAGVPTDLGAMVTIPAGTFHMGDLSEERARPVHTVTLSAFSIDKYETTVGQYKACVVAGACASPVITHSLECNWGKPGREGHPINCVTWGEAGAYCAWAGKRVPTEAEWEYAARGTTAATFPWGSEPATCARARFSPRSGPRCGEGTSVVGSHPSGASPFGVQDMAGNVDEWVVDGWFDAYVTTTLFNPVAPSHGSKHVIRGGNWNYESAGMRAFSRWYADKAGDYIGIRCAK